MTQPTTDECIGWLDGHIKALRIAHEFDKWVEHFEGIRAQLIAAKEMSKAIKNYEEWRDKFTKGVGYDGLPQDYYPRETNRKALTAWQKAGGQ